jgi:hypothetical protein
MIMAAQTKRAPTMFPSQIEMRFMGSGGGHPIRHVGPAVIIPFPSVRRVGFIERTAELATSYRDPRRYLDSVLKQQEKALRRRGLTDDVVRSEIDALAGAIQRRMAMFEILP